MIDIESSTEAVSIQGQVEYAESKVGHAQPKPVSNDDISALRLTVCQLIDSANLNSDSKGRARAKMEEMIFWIRAGMGKG
jgi:hypothetical protein